MFKNLIGAALLVASSSLVAEEITDYSQITEYLITGHDAHFVINTKDCTVNDPNEYKIPDQIIVAKPRIAVITEKAISFAGAKYTHAKKPLPKHGLMQRGSFRLNREGTLHGAISFFDAVTNKKTNQWQDVNITCQLGTGLKVYS